MGKKFTTLVAVSIALLILSGCGAANRSAVRDSFQEGQKEVYIGMERWEFDYAMARNVAETKPKHRRSSEAYQRNGVVYEIVYIRSGFVLDDATTDDEYTPYLFQDGTLIGYGWAAVGGKKTDSADIAKAAASATKVEQNVEVNQSTQSSEPFKIPPTCIHGSPLKVPGCD